MRTDECDPEIFRKGEPLALLREDYIPEETITRWVRAVATKANARVDWHITGGWAQVLFIGDAESRARAVAALREHDGTDGIRVHGFFRPGARGRYRHGVTTIPRGVGATY